MALSAYNTTLSIGGSAIAEVTNLSVGGSSLTEIDITNLTSTNKEYIMGALEAGTLTIDFFAPANYADFNASLNPVSGDASATSFNLSFSGGSLIAIFDGICTNLSISAEQDGAVTASATVKLTSAITWSV
jgi:hypothetical protein